MRSASDQAGQIQESRDSGAGSWDRRVWVASAVVLVTAMVVLAVVVQLGGSRDVADQEQQIEDLKSKLAQARTLQEKAHDEMVWDALGVEPSRVRADTRVVRALARTALTWDSGDRYARSRESIQRRYDLRADSQFMTTLLPPPAVNRDAHGESYDAIDAIGANSSLNSLDVDVTGVVGTAYSYVADAVVTITSDSVMDGATERGVLIEITIDSSGQVTEASGYIAEGPTRESK